MSHSKNTKSFLRWNRFRKYFKSSPADQAIPKTLDDILDDVFVLKYNQLYLSLMRTTLMRSPVKDIGVYATRDINPGETIAYYKIFSFKQKHYQSSNNGKYAFQIYDEQGNIHPDYIGDLTEESMCLPIYSATNGEYVPFWGYFVNEPSPGEKVNACVCLNLEQNYKHRKKVEPHQAFVYSIVAERPIHSNQEVLIHYGDHYHLRNYDVDASIQ
jgi:hypothetical protein